MKSNWKRNSIIYIIILVAFVVLFSVFLPGTEKTEEVPLSDVITMSQNKEIATIEVDGEDLLITKIDGTKVKSVKEANSTIYEITGLVLPVALGAAAGVAVDDGSLCGAQCRCQFIGRGM